MQSLVVDADSICENLLSKVDSAEGTSALAALHALVSARIVIVLSNAVVDRRDYEITSSFDAFDNIDDLALILALFHFRLLKRRCCVRRSQRAPAVAWWAQTVPTFLGS